MSKGLKKVLIVDDEETLTWSMAKSLSKDRDKYEVMIANNGKEALAQIATVKLDLVLLDIMMPDMDGWDVFRKMKEKDPGIPIAILTAKAQNIDKLLGLHVLKADDYITKPFGKNELISKVKKLTESTEKNK